VFLHRVLRDHDVPVAEILATTADDRASLMQFLPGELLGDLARRVPPAECVGAWRAAGAALRRAHSLVLGEGTSGAIVGMGVQPFEAGSWGQFHLASVLGHAERLAAHRLSSVPLDLHALRDVMEAALPLLDDAPLRLLHNDAHPWNVLVVKTCDAWECSGWLDWEYAWVGDPTWDLVRMDVFRPKPLTSTPVAFYEGYGAFPAEPARSLYELHIQLWMAADYLAGNRALQPTYEAALKYVGTLDERVGAIHDLLRTPGTR
jgi:aminoglycoside phosphotransferase (APT) family kinase protein